jgi:hypothetical protein
MKPAQAKPVRRRRRWLSVAFVLVLVSTVSWWYWPRGDARFVGKWNMILATQSGYMRFVSNGVVVLSRNGTGEARYFEDSKGTKFDKGPPKRFAWAVTGDSYREGFPTATSSANAMLDRLRPWLPRKLRWRTESSSSEYQIETVTEQSIKMSSKIGGSESWVELTRLPE